MNGESVDDRCDWEELLLGRPHTLRKGATIPILVLLGGWVAYVQFDHPTGPREERALNSATLLSDVAVPEPLWKEAEKLAVSRVFRDYARYREFLEREQLLEGVLIIRACSENGGLLYHAFPPLDDRNTFSNLIAVLPDLASVRGHPEPPFDRTRVCSFQAKELASRGAAERLFGSDCFPPTKPEQGP